MTITSTGEYRTYYIGETDYQSLLNFLEAPYTDKLINTHGKYYMYGDIEYPRYKMKASLIKLNPKIKRTVAKNEGYADFVIINKEALKQILTENTKFIDTAKVLRNGNTLYRVYEIRWITPRKLSSIKDLMIYYLAYKDKRTISFADFDECSNSHKERITIKTMEPIKNLLESTDKSSIQLGMEMLANCDFDKSKFAILALIQGGFNLHYHDYYSTTAFKAFRNKFADVFNTDLRYGVRSGPLNIYKMLCAKNEDNKPILITKAEYEYLLNAVYEEILSNIEHLNIVSTISKDQLTLPIDPANIIDDDILQDIEDQVDDAIIEEDDNNAYELIDDEPEISQDSGIQSVI